MTDWRVLARSGDYRRIATELLAAATAWDLSALRHDPLGRSEPPPRYRLNSGTRSAKAAVAEAITGPSRQRSTSTHRSGGATTSLSCMNWGTTFSRITRNGHSR